MIDVQPLDPCRNNRHEALTSRLDLSFEIDPLPYVQIPKTKRQRLSSHNTERTAVALNPVGALKLGAVVVLQMLRSTSPRLTAPCALGLFKELSCPIIGILSSSNCCYIHARLRHAA
jgi:hypothetical protein